MASRDRLQSYQFLIQRVVSALVMRETDPLRSPLRRGIGAVFAGLMIAVVVGAGFGVYGLLTRIGGDDWRTERSVVVERETGATYVYLSGRLYPTLNLASALLAAARPDPSVLRVSTRALAAAPRGVTIGISGAPDSLPAPDQVIGLPWTVCASTTVDAAGTTARLVGLVVGAAPDGARALGQADALLVRDGTGGPYYLVWQGHRYLLRGPELVIPALFGAVVAPVPVGTAWLTALPVGADIGPITVPGRGTPAAAAPGRRVGDVLVAPTGAGPQYYLVLDDGLAPITALQKDILAAQYPAPAAPVSVAAVTAVRPSPRLRPAEGEVAPPPSAPALAQTLPAGVNSILCARTDDPRVAPVVSTGGGLPSFAAAVPTSGRGGPGPGLADLVLVPAGRIAVIRVLASPAATDGAYSLVTDQGVRYPVPSADVLGFLGYGPDRATDVPAHLAARLPTGPTLDPAAATHPSPLPTGAGPGGGSGDPPASRSAPTPPG